MDFMLDEGMIMYGVYVDDCGEGYVVLVMVVLLDDDCRWRIVGKVFNIFGRRYEILCEVGVVLV